MTGSLYNPSKLVRHTQARADDVNRELLKIQAAIDELQAALVAAANPDPEPIKLYTWMAWANSSDGTIDFTTSSPGGRSWVGFAFNRLVETPSNNPGDYRWTQISGALGNFVALDTTNVAGRNAIDLVGDLDTLATQLLAYQFDRQTLRDYVDTRLYVDGEPVNTVIVTEKNQRKTETTALAETISLIGAKAPSGASFILDLNKTYVSPTVSLGARLTAIQSEAQSASASVQSLQQTIATANYATASDLSLLGAKTTDGSAFVLNLSTVKASPTQTFAQYINSAVAAAAGNAASVTQIFDAVINPNGATSKAILRLNSNGHVIGYEATNNGTTGTITFTIDKFQLLDTGGRNLFTASGGVVKMPNVEVDTIKAGAIISASLATNAAAKPATVSSASTISGGGVGVWYDVLVSTITIDKPATIYATVTASQGFPSGDRQYGNELQIGGVPVFSVGGAKTLDSVTVAGSRYLPAGTYEIKYRWYGEASTRLYGRTMFVLAIY